MERQFLTLKEISTITGLSRESVRQLVINGTLPGIRPTPKRGKWLVPADKVRELLGNVF